jgi:hypothetical protein
LYGRHAPKSYYDGRLAHTLCSGEMAWLF